MTIQTLELPPLDFRAAVSSVNEAARTVEVIFSTGAAVDRRDWTGKAYREVLSLDPGAVRLGRLNSGAPLLNSHSAYSLSDVIGVVEPGSARVDGRQGTATVRFSQRPDADAVWQDVLDGIVRSVSVGYRVHKLEETASKDNTPVTRTAVDWEPYELSMVSMPADAGAHVRGTAGETTNLCEIVQRSGGDSADLMRACRLEFAREGIHFPERLKTKFFGRSYVR